ncbi:FKBP-type peptidyl-prolyl cis-trans isomerase [Mucilaginibacter sp. PAMB04274]|uniref:FKBP-type peptidyl-prolyl cis-trans isomerase n=1 Tax=Mucilaginibacter sp. PAMB04274 TaxID=3138568 RepID=UPI0031F6EC4A
MLKIVNLPYLFFKKVNLPITNKVMNRLLWFCCCVLLFTACKKQDDPAVINPDQAATDDQVIQKYITDNGITGAKRVENVLGRPDTIGVWYVIEKQGPVNTLYSLASNITVGFTGRELTSGRQFASTGDVHPAYRLGEVIKGWQVGLPKVYKGGIIRLLVSSRYAYGPYRQPLLGLDANAVLDFRIEVFDVTN